MKKILALTVMLAILLFVGSSVALANHGGPHCSKSGMPTAGNSGKACYPPPGNGALNGGNPNPTSFSTEASEAGGMTVGMATLIALGGVGTLLVVRRRWVFRTNGK